MNVRLKNIHIKNFKSFAGLTIINDIKSFNVIIGSNGSGKSNFMEAIAFCFGESSSRTRPTNLENLINSSVQQTDRECYVAATLESEKNDLTIKRTIKKNRSLFSINDESVDKDTYQNKLTKIGINIKARYFIIYQGEQIELLMESSHQRSIRFEEITGSIEYKEEYDRLAEEINSKTTQLKDLKNEKIRVSKKRRNRIIFERKEATVLQLNDDYEKTETKFFLIQLYVTEEKMKDSLERRKILEQAKQKLTDRKKNTRSNRSHKVEELYLIQKQLESLEDQVISMTQAIKILETKLISQKNKIETTEQKIMNSKKLLEKANEVDEAHKRNIDQLEKDYTETKKLRNEIKKQLDQELSEERSEEAIENFNNLKEKISSKISNLTLNLKVFKHEQKELLSDLKKKKKEIAKITSKNNETGLLLESHEKCLKQYETLKHELEELKRSEKERKELYKLCQKKEAEIENELKNVQDQLNRLEANQVNIKKSNAKMTLMKCLKEAISEGVYGYLDELCQPIHTRYGVALATALREFSSIIIVDTQKTAHSCLKLIRAERFARTKILPLDVLTTPKLHGFLRDIKTYEGVKNVNLLIDIVKYPQEVQTAVLFAFKDTLVCENTKDAIHVAYELESKKRFNCIALDGTFYRENGIMSRNKHGIERDTALADITDKSSLKEKYNDLLMRLNDVREQLKQLNLNQISGQLQMKITSMDKMIAIVAQINAQNEERIEHTGNLQSQLTTLLNDEQKIEKQLKDLENKIMNIEQKINSTEQPMYKEFYERYNIKNISLFQNSIVKLAKLRSQKNEYEQHLQAIKEILENEKKTDTESNTKKYIKKIENLQQQLQKEKDEYIELQKDHNKHTNELVSSQKQLDEVRNEIVQLNDEIKKLDLLLSKISSDFRSNIHNFKEYSSLYKRNLRKFKELLLEAQSKTVNLPFIQGSYDSIINLDESDDYDDDSIIKLDLRRAELNIKLDYTAIEKEINNDNLDNLQLLSDKVKAQLAEIDEKLCENNLVQEDSQELTAINEELKIIEKKIIKIKAEIIQDEKLFELIKRKRIDTFKKGFEEVTESVKKIYKKLCGNENAHAFLEALNPTEPYSGDIQYFCIPPGKKFMFCCDLSGGEKTLAMLSLVFAILKANSSFILLLDEIDAPLDKIHFQNIVNYLNELKEFHQIIYITLNSKIMEHASGLIGLHSKESNGSKKSVVFTLDLNSP